MSDPKRDFAEFLGTYSPDVEIDENGVLRYSRDIQKGEFIQIPAHMMNKVVPSKRSPD